MSATAMNFSCILACLYAYKQDIGLYAFPNDIVIPVSSGGV